MQYGVCTNIVELLRKGELDETLKAIAGAGFSYVEANAAACADITAVETEDIIAALVQNDLSCKRACVLFPGTIKVVGPEVSENAIREYISGLMPKLASLGVEVVVFGSGGARRIPDGYDYNEAFRQFCACAKIVADIGNANGVKVALEHLNPKETNLLTTIEETVKAVRQVTHPNCGLLFDYYHVDFTSGDLEQVYMAKDVLFHSHIAMPESRLFPLPGDEDVIRPYFDMLRKSEYDGTVSIEARPHEDRSFAENLDEAYKLLTAL